MLILVQVLGCALILFGLIAFLAHDIEDGWIWADWLARRRAGRSATQALDPLPRALSPADLDWIRAQFLLAEVPESRHGAAWLRSTKPDPHQDLDRAMRDCVGAAARSAQHLGVEGRRRNQASLDEMLKHEQTALESWRQIARSRELVTGETSQILDWRGQVLASRITPPHLLVVDESLLSKEIR